MVKLCGNFLIASSIEAIGEAVALSEKNVSHKFVTDKQIPSILRILLTYIRKFRYLTFNILHHS